MLLVLDDYHLIGSQPVHASLLFLLEHLPSGLRLVLTSRSDPPLAWSRQARGDAAGAWQAMCEAERAAPWTRPKSTSATSWASSARPTAPRLCPARQLGLIR